MDDLPLPNPPSGWALSSCRTKVKQFVHSVEYEYEYTYTKKPRKPKNLPASIEPPVVPVNWITTKSKHTAEKNADSHVYRYALAYRSPNLPSASAAQVGAVSKAKAGAR
jgi:nucleoside-diphosphate-sugar epimerase